MLSLYELDMDETVLVVETPKDTRLGDYATSAAMKLARSLRKNPVEIAEQLAFNTVNYFIQSFREVTGYTPAQYRKRF